MRDKIRPARPLSHSTRERVRPARHKTPILGHFEHAGRTISRTTPPPPMRGAPKNGGPGCSAREQRQGTAIALQLAQGLRQSTALFAQQQPRRAPPVQNSPCSPALAACAVQNSPSKSHTAPLPVQNSPRSPEMAQFGAFSACRESFIPLSPPRSRAGRILYRTRGRDGARQHNSTPGATGVKPPEGAGGTGGPGHGAGCGRLTGPAWVGGASARQISHIISHGHFSRPPKNVAIPTMQIQCLKKLQGNYVRNCCADGPGRGTGGRRRGPRRRRGLAGLRDATPRPPHTHISHIISLGHFWR